MWLTLIFSILTNVNETQFDTFKGKNVHVVILNYNKSHISSPDLLLKKTDIILKKIKL